MTDLVVWSGPVANFQIPDATLSGAVELFLGCRGDKGDWAYCPQIGAELEASPSLLLARAKVPRRELGNLVLAAFSAGGSVLRRLLPHEAYRQLATVVYLADAMFTADWANAARREPPPIEPFVLFALDVLLDDSKLMIATASPSQNGKWATGVENLDALRREIERRSGRTMERVDTFGGIEPGPERVYKLGNVWLAAFPMKPLGHNHPEIADQVFAKMIGPFLRGGAGTPTREPVRTPARTPALPSRSIVRGGIALALGAALGVATWLLGRRRRS